MLKPAGVFLKLCVMSNVVVVVVVVHLHFLLSTSPKSLCYVALFMWTKHTLHLNIIYSYNLTDQFAKMP